MADWSKPTLLDLYTSVLTEIQALAQDAGQMFFSAPTNLPSANFIRYNRSTNQFEEWDGTSTWNPKVIAITGGGTGQTTVAGIRTALSLGTMALQNANSVNITGGAVTAGSLTGVVPQAALGSGSDGSGTHFLADDQTYKSINTAFLYSYLTKSTNYTITNSDLAAKTIIKCIGGTSFQITLPTVVGNDRYFVIVKNVQGIGSITVQPNGGETIDSASNLVIPPGVNGAYFSFTLVADAASSNWNII